MKKEIIGFLVFFDVLVGGTSLIGGVITTFFSALVGWGLIVLGIWLLTHFYFLLWGVEEVLRDDAIFIKSTGK